MNLKNLVLKSPRIKVGSIMFELIQPITDNSVYKDCFNNRGEGVADLSFIVDDLFETQDLVSKGADFLVSTDECSIIDTKKKEIQLLDSFNNV